MTTYRNRRRRPQTLLEARAPLELGQLLALAPFMRLAPRGTGRGVLVLPGLAASDLSTRPLRRYLRSQGHHVHGWRLGRNDGPTPRVVDGLAERLAEVLDRHDDDPIAIVGWSLGGVYALALARLVPARVRRVITLGSPLAALDDPQMRAGTQLRRAVRASVGPADGPLAPLTSIWSRTDAIVPFGASRVGINDPLAEDIEVRSSHLGIGWSPAALYTVADRLALADATLPPFRAPRGLSGAWPDPARTPRRRRPGRTDASRGTAGARGDRDDPPGGRPGPRPR